MDVEINFDGLVGPTHNYGGLSYGNIASMENENISSNPRAAALQALEKSWFLAALGMKQGIIPPQERPHLPTLRALGFTGSDTEILNHVAKESPQLLLAVSSASAMWTANAATVSPSADCEDKRVHITPANLHTKFHRSIETLMSGKILKKIFPEGEYFAHHPSLPSHEIFGDEGSANHMRLCSSYGERGVELFIFGKLGFEKSARTGSRFPSRQNVEASKAIARLHQLDKRNTLYLQQNPHAIDSGVFHNDVIAICNQDLMLYHEDAFLNSSQKISEIEKSMMSCCGIKPQFIEISSKRLSLTDAVNSYLFNSQLITLPTGAMALIAPHTCQTIHKAKDLIDEIIGESDNPIERVYYFDLQESMRNGGGPACLRLRTALTEEQCRAVNPTFMLTEKLYRQLKEWIERYYRDQLTPKELADPLLLYENRNALESLSNILQLGTLYEFQR